MSGHAEANRGKSWANYCLLPSILWTFFLSACDDPTDVMQPPDDELESIAAVEIRGLPSEAALFETLPDVEIRLLDLRGDLVQASTSGVFGVFDPSNDMQILSREVTFQDGIGTLDDLEATWALERVQVQAAVEDAQSEILLMRVAMPPSLKFEFGVNELQETVGCDVPVPQWSVSVGVRQPTYVDPRFSVVAGKGVMVLDNERIQCVESGFGVVRGGVLGVADTVHVGVASMESEVMLSGSGGDASVDVQTGESAEVRFRLGEAIRNVASGVRSEIEFPPGWSVRTRPGDGDPRCVASFSETLGRGRLLALVDDGSPDQPLECVLEVDVRGSRGGTIGYLEVRLLDATTDSFETIPVSGSTATIAVRVRGQ